MARLAVFFAIVCLAGCSRRAEAPAETATSAQEKAGPVRITHFYAGAKEIERSQNVGLCYGVENAKAVHLEPPVESLQPGYNRCFYLTPDRKTTYKLIAEGPDGSTATAALTVNVREPSSPAGAGADRTTYHGLFTLTFASAPEISPGDSVTLCYGAPEAVSVTVDPPVMSLRPAARHCFQVHPERTTTYRFSAASRERSVETAELTVKVRELH